MEKASRSKEIDYGEENKMFLKLIFTANKKDLPKHFDQWGIEVNKTVAVARLLSGDQYVETSDWHSRHWSPTNEEGFCLLGPGKNIPGTIEHLHVTCEALDPKRSALFNFWEQKSEDSLPLQELLLTIRRSSTKEFVQSVLDPSVVQRFITGCQKKLFQLDEVFHLTRTTPMEYTAEDSNFWEDSTSSIAETRLIYSVIYNIFYIC